MIQAARTALLLEDEPIVLTVFRKALENTGFTVLVAERSEAAHRWSNDPRVQIDVIVADLVLPGPSGTDAVLNIRASRPEIPVLFTSGTPIEFWPAADLRNLSWLPNDSYSFLQKPFTVQAFIKSVQDLLSRRSVHHTV